MAKDERQHYRELLILKTIAETLNQSNDLRHMLQSALEKLLEVTDLQAGWIFLVDDEPIYHHMADHNLPPALSWEEKKPMKCSDCLCLGMYWANLLNKAVNIVKCERLDNAVRLSWGDTHNLTHHATVPLTIRGERFGILNVASPGKEHFSGEELTLLESVAYQIGTAVERTRLYGQEKKRGQYYANIDEVTRNIWKINDLRTLLTTMVEQIGVNFGWSTVAIMINEGDQLTLRAMHKNGTSHWMDESVQLPEDHVTSDIIIRALREQKVQNGTEQDFDFPALRQNGSQYATAIPLQVHDEPLGVLFIGEVEGEALQEVLPNDCEVEIEIFKVLAEHISLAMENLRLFEERQDLLLAEERNRLARDLHDSVNQKLFSLSLTARGIKGILRDKNEDVLNAVDDIGQLVQEALTEMRSLIWQLRPYGLEKGIVASLKEYAAKIGLHLTVEAHETVHIPKKVEEALLRIGQEALNNVRKHAQSNRASLRIEFNEGVVHMSLSDRGRGFAMDQADNGTRSLGMTSMRERAELINGSLEVKSEPGKGTIITVTVPTS